MNIQEFFNKWTGKYCEVAGSPGATNQCVDLANAYIRDVLGLPIIEWTNAIDFPAKVGDKYDYIKNTPDNVPQEGDIIIWGKTPGHIAIFIEGNVNTFKSFDQNYPVGSPCHVQGHTYANVLGWLRAKTGTIGSQQPISSAALPQITDQTPIPQIDGMQVQAIRSQLMDLNRDNDNLKREVFSLKGEIKELEDKLGNVSIINYQIPENKPQGSPDNTPKSPIGKALHELALKFG